MYKHKQIVIRDIKITVIAPVCCIICYLVYIFANRDIQFNYINILSFAFSVELISNGFTDLKTNGIGLHNAFLITFFSCLALNNLNISALQKPKTFVDVFYFFVGPLLFALVLYTCRKPSRFKLRKVRYLDPNKIALVLLLLIVILKMILIRKTGIRLTSNDWLMNDASKYTVSGVTGLSQMCMWILLMMLPDVSKKMKIVSIVVILVNVVLNAGRGDIMRVLIYLVIMWVSFFGKKFITKKNVCYLFVFLFVISIFFSLWGNYRQYKRGWSESVSYIGTHLKSYSNNDFVNWLYSYTAFNFDVLKQINIDGKATGNISVFFTPLIRILKGSEAVEQITLSAASGFVSGFNASTFLSDFISTMGKFYFVGLVFLGIFVALLDTLCSIVEFRGGHIFLLMLTVLTIFGNYYLNVNLLYSLIVGIFIYCFIGEDYPYLSNFQ